MARARRRTTLVSGFLVALLAGCGSASSPSVSAGASAPRPSSATESFGPANVQRAIDDLASLGIETRVRPSDTAPLSTPTGDRSLVRLLRLQVRNLALEQAGGGGTRGADLDALSAAAGGGPVSTLVAGWLASARTPAATWAASLRREAPGDPKANVVPTLALVAFLADASGNRKASGPPPEAVSVMFRGAGGATFDGAAGQAASSDLCADVSAYLSATLSSIVDSTAEPPAWLKQVIDQYAPQYKNNPGLLRRTIGAIALLTYATSLARPWTVSLVPAPAAVAYGVEGQDPVTGDVNLTVLSGADVFATDVADCASLANAQLASIPVKDSLVVWDASGLGAHATEAQADPKVDENGAASLTYTTATESKDTAQNGDPVTTQVWVSGWVNRAEMAPLAAVVKSILLGDAAGSPAGATAKALYQAMEPTLNTVMRPSGFALIDVTYHTPKASPSPSQVEADLTGNWNGTWAINGYPNTGDFTMKLVQSGSSFSGTVVSSNTDCPTGTVNGTVAGSNVTFGWVLSAVPVQFTGAISSTSMSGTWSAVSCSNGISLTGIWQATKQK